MSDIVSNLERVISELDERTSSLVPKDYGTDIASMVDHIRRQIDKIPSGGSGGGSNLGYKVIKINRSVDGGDIAYSLNNLSDWDEIVEDLDNGTYVLLWGVTNGDLLTEGPLFNYCGRRYSSNGSTEELYFSGNTTNTTSGFTTLRIIKDSTTIETL